MRVVIDVVSVMAAYAAITLTTSLGTSSSNNLRQPTIVPVAVDAVEICTPDDGQVCRPKHVE